MVALETDQAITLVEAALSGERLSLARVLTQVENNSPAGCRALDVLFPHTGRAHLIGVTGSPGTGKSSLVNRLAKALRVLEPTRSRRVAIVAVDPTSPFSGGAVLGDRVRMRELVGDPGVFIRSMATRGALGGLAQATANVVQVFDAVGYDYILIETVGAGQSEVDIARLAHTTLVVEAPGLGDDIQSIKAGILEIADILVVNKADRPGADATEKSLRNMLELAHPTEALYHHARCPEPEGVFPIASPPLAHTGEGWTPPVLKTIATRGEGIEQLLQAILDHGEFIRRTGEWNRRDQQRLQAELQAKLQETLLKRWRANVSDRTLASLSAELMERRKSPGQVIDELLEER